MITMNSDHLQSIQYKPVVVQNMYHSNKRTLFVGEGDFSFASSLATQYGVANNIVATSLDSIEDLYKKYHTDAFKNINNLIRLGAQVFHGVDVHDMATRHGRTICGFEKSFYDVINFNFPHAGFYEPESDPEMIRRHTVLIQLFFTNAAYMLAPRGLVYVSHKCGFPYDAWNLEEQAKPNGFDFLGVTPFYSSNFPGYKHRRGGGSKAGEIFKLGRATTYIFEIRDNVWIDNIIEDPLKTGYIYDILLQISNLRSFKEGMIKSGRASSEDNLLQMIATEVTRLEAMTLRKEGQKKLNSLKLMIKVMRLAVKAPSVVARITSLQATSPWKRGLQKCAARVLEEAFQEEQSTKFEKGGMGAPREGENRGTAQWEPCEEQCRFDSRKSESPHGQQRAVQGEEASEIQVADNIAKEGGLDSEGEEASEIQVADNIAKEGCLDSEGEEASEIQVADNIAKEGGLDSEGEEASEIQVADNIAKEGGLDSEGEEEEPSVSAAGLDTRMRQCTGQEGMERENIITGERGHESEDSNHESTMEQVDLSLHLQPQGSKEGHRDRPDGEGCGAYKTSLPGGMEDTLLPADMEDSAKGVHLKYIKHSLVERICTWIRWIREYSCGCFGTSTDCCRTKRL